MVHINKAQNSINKRVYIQNLSKMYTYLLHFDNYNGIEPFVHVGPHIVAVIQY